MGLKRLFTSQKEVIGLDIGTGWVKVVQLRKDRAGYIVTSLAQTEINPDAEDERGRTNNIIKAIGEAVKLAQIKTKYAVCGICGEEVAARNFKFPPLNKHEIVNAVLYEAEQVCPFDSGKFIVDHQVLESSVTDLKQLSDSKEQGGSTQGLLVAATPEVIGQKRQFIKASGLRCVLMDVDGLALLNCFLGIHKLESGETIAILDVGKQFSNLAIISDKRLPFIRDIHHAGDEIIQYISKEKKLSVNEVHISLSVPNENSKGSVDVTGCLEHGCTTLITEVTETLRYYAIQEGQAVSSIYVCGRFAMAKGLVNCLDAQLPPVAKLWNPFETMRCEISPQSVKTAKNSGAVFALAAGLAMRTI